MSTQATGAAPKMRGWVRVLLIASVTLNLLVAGVVIGGVLRHDRHPPAPNVGDVSLGPLTEAFSREDRAALRDRAQERGQNFRDMRQQAKADMEALIAAIDAEPYDPQRVSDLLARQRERTLERAQIGGALIAERLEAMGPEARRALAERLRRGGRHFGPPRDKPDNR